MSRHPSDDDLERFLAARLAPTDQQRVIQHLLAGCGVCSRKLVGQAPESLLESASASRRASKTRNLLRDQTLADVMKQDARWSTDERKLARSLELLRRSPDSYDQLSVRQVGNLQGPAFVEALLRRVAELRYKDPKDLRWLAYNAVKAAEGLESTGRDSRLTFDLQARTWAELANAYRINEEFDEAAGAFSQSRTRLRRGSGNLRLLAQVAEFEASFLRLQRRMAEVADLTDAIYKVYGVLGDLHLQGRALISKALYLQFCGAPKRSLSTFQEGFALIQPEREPQMIPILQQSLIGLLVKNKRFQEAERLFLRSGLRESFQKLPLALIKVRWVEAHFLAHLGRASDAERAFLDARNSLLEMGLDYDAALVGLDLLPFWTNQGRPTKVYGLAREVYGVFRDLGIRPEAAKAERYFH